MLAPNTLLQGRYRVIRLLGQGGMGAVYEAADERLDTTVALKETLFADERLRKQFEREARLLARLHHPALPRVSDHFSEGEGQFLVMQFIDGDDLAQMMKVKHGPFPIDQVLTWGDQLLDALDYLHTQDPQIIHRDIKPQNLKLTSRGQIILLDFGLAKGQTGGMSAVTTSASIYGYTPNYAPLEQIQGLGTDARSDLYALSATLYHLMTGIKPPDALTRAAALVNGQPDPLVPANEIYPVIGPEISSVLARGMSQNREQRYPTAAGMRAALNGTGEVATLVGKTEAATMLFQTPAVTVGAGSAPGTAAHASSDRPTETTVVRSRDTARNRMTPWAKLAAAAALVGILFGGFYAYQLHNAATTNPPQTNSASPTPQGLDNPPAAGPVATATPTESPGIQHEDQRAQPVPSAARVEAAKQTDKAATRPEKNIRKQAGAQFPAPPKPGDESYVPGDVPVQPATPNVNTPDLSRLGRRKQLDGVSVRTLADGTQVITSPDGMRILVSPNGARRILRPGQRIRRNLR